MSKFDLKKAKTETESAIPVMQGGDSKAPKKAPERTAGLGTRIQADIHRQMKIFALEQGISLADLIEQSATEYMSKKA